MTRISVEPVHPGVHLADELAARGWGLDDLALMGIPVETWQDLIHGRCPARHQRRVLAQPASGL
ncbi:MAG: hypothetical protein AB7R89_16030 [Dehalococcoidia bacterium]